MPKLFLEELAPDMVLEKPIKDQFGLILFQKGVVLSEKTINTLKMWGISEVSIEVSSIEEHVNDSPQVDPAVTAQAEANVELLFRHNHLRGVFVKELMRHIAFRQVKQRIKELANAQ
ncbi:MAG: hypothetical protein KA247_02510 [Bacteroidetes bacterium]|nr:hypothetical protein [Bacteroidota bacterium]